MTFEEYWHSEYPPLYEVGKAVARAAWEAASLDADKARAALVRYKLALESLTPGGSEFSDSPERCVEFVRSREKFPARILRLEAENARLTAEAAWIPVMERLPENSNACLVSDGKNVAMAHWFHKLYNQRTKEIEPGEWGNYSFASEYVGHVTHWRPLPTHPDAARVQAAAQGNGTIDNTPR